MLASWPVLRGFFPASFVVLTACMDDTSAEEDGPACAALVEDPTPAVVPVSAAPLALDVGPFTKVLDVPGRYVNDHGFYPKDGRWHLHGIYDVQPRPSTREETDFVHATATEMDPALWTTGTFTVAPPPADIALSARPDLGETHIWAPHVVANGGESVMFFHVGLTGGAAGMASARSTDLVAWDRSPVAPLFTDVCVARDPMVTKVDGRWIMYYTRCNDPCIGRSAVAYRTSDDLVTWSEPSIALDLSWSRTMGNSGFTESPFVFHRGEYWYLSVTAYPIEWVATFLFRSRSPFQFDDVPVARITAHAAEWIAKNGDLEHEPLFVSHCGPGQEGVYVAPVDGL